MARTRTSWSVDAGALVDVYRRFLVGGLGTSERAGRFVTVRVGDGETVTVDAGPGRVVLEVEVSSGDSVWVDGVRLEGSGRWRPQAWPWPRRVAVSAVQEAVVHVAVSALEVGVL